MLRIKCVYVFHLRAVSLVLLVWFLSSCIPEQNDTWVEFPDYEEDDEDTFVTTWGDETVSLVENVDALSGTISLSTAESTDEWDEGVVTAEFRTFSGQYVELTLGQYSFLNNTDFPFILPASLLPFNITGAIVNVSLKVSQQYEDAAGIMRTYSESCGDRYYKHNGDGTLTHFNYETFWDTFDACLFNVENASDGQPLLDNDGDQVGLVLSECEGVGEIDW